MPSQKLREVLVNGRLGEVALGMTLDEVVRRLGPADGSIARSRKNREPAALKYGLAQLFFNPDGGLDTIGLYPRGDAEASQVLVDVEFAEYLRAMSPSAVLDAVSGEALTLVEECDGGKIVRERRAISDVHQDADCLRVLIASGGETTFVRDLPGARWSFERLSRSRRPYAYPLREG